MYSLTGRTADDAWLAAASLFRPEGPARTHVGRGGEVAELLHAVLEIEDPRQHWVFSRTPAINPSFALVEVFWIASGRQDARLPAFWNPRLPEFCGNTPVLHGAYGYRLRAHFGIDQLDRVHRLLEARPESRQAVLELWDPVADLPHADGKPVRADIPCNVVAMPKVRDGRLEWLQVMRSNDLFRGLPYNLVQFASIQEMLAGWLGLEVGSYLHVSDSLHVYVEDLTAVQASEPALAAPTRTNSFALPRREWDAVVADVIRRLESMANRNATQELLRGAAFAHDAPAAYEDAVRIAAADAARRRGWNELAQECASGCSDEALRVLWTRWADRTGLRRFDTETAVQSGAVTTQAGI